MGYDGNKRSAEQPIDDQLKTMMKKGKISAPDVQATSAAIIKTSSSSGSGGYNSDSGIAKWAKAGACGSRPGNISRDLTATMAKQSAKAEIYAAPVKFWDCIEGKQFEDDMYFLAPHETLAKEVTEPHEWTSLPEDGAYSGLISDWKTRENVVGDDEVAGAGLWADSATYHTRDSLYLVLFNILTGVHQIRFWIAAWSKRMMCDCGCKGRCTFASVWEVIIWPFNALQAGRFPSVRSDGTPFDSSTRIGDAWRAKMAGKPLPFRCGPIQFRADWSFLKCALNLTGWRPEGDTLRVCWKCLADCTRYPFTSVGFDALWRGTLLTHQIYLQMCMANNIWVSEVFGLPGFRLEHITADLMHCVDLGIVQYLLGNVIWELCFVEMKGLITKPNPILGEMMVMFRIASKALSKGLTIEYKCPISSLTIGMLRKDTKAPKMKTKAAEGRKLVPVVRWILENMFKQESAHEKLRYNCVKAIDMFYTCLDVPASIFDPKSCALYARRHISLWAELGLEALDNLSHQHSGWVSFRYYPKHHLTLHCVEDQVANSGNPRRNWCYMDEDAIGKAVAVAEELHAKTLHRSVVERHRL